MTQSPRFRHIGLIAAIAAAFLVVPSKPSPAFEGSGTLSGSYLAGRMALQSNDLDAAARYFSNALKRDPTNIVFLEQAFLAHLSIANIDRAEALAGQLLAANSRHRMARIVEGLRKLRDNDFVRARGHLTNAAYTPIGILTATLLEGWAWAGDGNADKAYEALDNLRQDDSFSRYREFNEALIADFLGDSARTEELYERIYEGAGNTLRVALAYGNYLERTNRASKARDIYHAYRERSGAHPQIEAALSRLAIAQDAPPPFIGDIRSGAAEALFSIAGELASQSGEGVAIAYLQLALSMRPDLEIANALLGNILESMERYASAIAAYRRIGEDSPLWRDAQIRIAVAHADMGETKKAYDDLRVVLEVRPDDYRVLVTLGDLLRRESRFEEAIPYYGQAISLPENARPENIWSTYYARGICYERSGQWDKAEADFKMALQLEEDQPLVLNYLGYSWLERDEHLERAYEMIKRAVEQRPSDPYIIDSLGWAYYKLGDFERAAEELERAVELKPNEAVLHDHLGDAYWQLGRKLEAGFSGATLWSMILSPILRPKYCRSSKMDCPIAKRSLRRGAR